MANEMDSEDKRNIWICAIITICITVILVALIYAHICRVKYFTEAGYTRKTLPGYDYPQWVKEEKE